MRAFVVLGLVFFSIPSQEIGLEKRLRSDLFCVEWDVKPQLSQSVSRSLCYRWSSRRGSWTRTGRAGTPDLASLCLSSRSTKRYRDSSSCTTPTSRPGPLSLLPRHAPRSIHPPPPELTDAARHGSDNSGFCNLSSPYERHTAPR